MATISITVANVLKSSNAQVNTGTIAAGVTITQGQALYQLANSTIGLADANGTSPANSFIGFSLTGGTAGQPVVYVSKDTAYASGGTLTSGLPVYLSDTPGAITQTFGDLASGSTAIVIGVANTDLTLNVSPVVGGVI